MKNEMKVQWLFKILKESANQLQWLIIEDL